MKLFFFLFFTLISLAFGQQKIDKLTTKDLTINGKYDVTSTSVASKPCPAMTQVQRDALSGLTAGKCVYNLTTNTLNAYNGSIWGSIGGGLSSWSTAYVYQAGDVVIESNKIYKALSNHTSGTFATDLAGGKWVELSSGVTDHTALSNIGTNTHAQIDSHIANTSNPHAVTKNQVGLGSVVNTDTTTTANITDSTNKRFVTDANLTTIGNQSGANTGDLKTKSDVDGADVTTTKLQYPNAQATTTASGVRRVETGNKNLLANASFEHSTVDNGWTVTGGGSSATSTTNLQDGAASVTRTSTGAWTFYQDTTLYATAKSGHDAEASIWVYSATASADLWLCPRVNGSSVTASTANGCVQYTNLGLPQKLTVFPLFGSTSTGIEIKGSGAITYILDDAYLGDRRPLVAGEINSPWSDCGLTTTDFTGFGTPTSITSLCRRDGPDLLMDLKYSTGTTSATEARVNLKLNGVALTSANTTYISTIRQAGTYASGQTSTNTHGGFMLMEPSVGYITFGPIGAFGSSSLNPLAKQNGTSLTIASSGEIINMKIRVPIAGWESNSNAYSIKCDDPRQCETVFSAQVSSTGVVSNENLDWISGNCTNANPRVCSFNTGIVSGAMNCQAIYQFDGSSFDAAISASSSSSVSVYTYVSSSGGTSAQPFSLLCQKQGSDYTNSKVAQQIIQMRDVPRTPGSGATYLMSAVVDASESVTENESNLISSCTNADPSVCSFTTNFTSTPKCWANPTTAGTIAIVTSRSTSSVTVDRTDASTPFEVFCQGTR